MADWLPAEIECDNHGFVLTGAEAGRETAAAVHVRDDVPGVFAVGDVRSGSVKRVASAVGEGSVVIQYVHRYLGTDVNVSQRPPEADAFRVCASRIREEADPRLRGRHRTLGNRCGWGNDPVQTGIDRLSFPFERFGTAAPRRHLSARF